MKNLLGLFIGMAFLPGIKAQTVTDYDGNVYNTVTIGSQVWMRENLKVTHYNNGVLIPNVTNDQAWGSLTTGYRCYYSNDSLTHAPEYGCLYNWKVASNANTCPVGWRVSSDADWNILEKFIEPSIDTATFWNHGTYVGGDMKEAGFTHWDSPNTGATNNYGLTLMPGSVRDASGYFELDCHNSSLVGYFGVYWTSTFNSSSQGYQYAIARYFIGDRSDLSKIPKMIQEGLSIRCVTNLGVGINEQIDETKVKLYPNPSNGNFMIETKSTEKQTVEVLDVNGQVVLAQTITGTSLIDGSKLTAGVYTVSLKGEEGIINKRLVIVK